jgi:Family of unknown function (DUF6328)
MAESEQERRNRELIELLNELRVALPGVQVLFAFLLTIPFTNKFDQLTRLDTAVYFAALLLCAVASGLLIAPSAHHRLRFRTGTKEQLVVWSNRMAIAGLVALALAVVASVSVIADLLYGEVLRIPLTITLLVVVAGLWFAAPLVLYSVSDDGDA